MDLTVLTDEELSQLAGDIGLEQKRRYVPKEMELLNLDYLTSEGTLPGQEWRQPAGAHDAYPLDWEVLHNSKTWASTTPFNVWEPGVANWREVVPEGAPPPAWVQPTSAEDDYNIGDKVTFEGAVYTSTIDANVWSPTDYPQGWAKDV